VRDAICEVDAELAHRVHDLRVDVRCRGGSSRAHLVLVSGQAAKERLGHL
jgi:hypothetical protein